MHASLDPLLLLSGFYEMIILMIIFREFLTWRISSIWLIIVNCLAISGQLVISAGPTIPAILGWFTPLIIFNTLMTSRLLHLDWSLMLPIVTFLNAFKLLILGSTLQFMGAHPSFAWHLQRILIDHGRIVGTNSQLSSALLLSLVVVTLFGGLAHHLMLRSNTALIFYRVIPNCHDQSLVLVSWLVYLYIRVTSFQHSLLTQVSTAALASIIFGGLVFYLVNANTSRLNNTQLLSDATHYNQVLSEHNQQLHLFKHDYQNILLSLSQYIAQEDLPGLKAYFEHEVLPNGQLLNQTIAPDQLRGLQAPALSGLIYAKYQAADNRHVKLQIMIPQPLTLQPPTQLKIVRVLGNLLDNAIDAATQSDQLVHLTITGTTSTITFNISNQLPHQTTIDLTQIKRQHFTTKSGHTGNGLNSIAQLVNKQLAVNYQVVNETFSAQLHVKL